MNISNPHMFYLILVVLLLMAVMIYGIRKRTRVLGKFIDPSLLSVMVPQYSLKRRWLKGMLLIGSLFFIVISLTGPEVGFRWEKVEQKGVDIMIALDCSKSMLATDIKPSRLEQAKREIIDLLKMMHSDRAGLVAFAGSAILQCPLTLDHSAFHIFLNALDPEYLPRGGTDIRGALQTALDSFETDVNSEKAIILITDGENTSGDPYGVVKEAAKKGVRIFCIGVGREEGAPVPDDSGGFKKDAQGRIIMSRVDDETLGKIAAMGMGVYVKSVAGDMDLDLIYTHEILKNMKKTTLQSGKKKVWENRFQWVLFPALLLLILELFISEQKKNKNGKASTQTGDNKAQTRTQNQTQTQSETKNQSQSNNQNQDSHQYARKNNKQTLHKNKKKFLFFLVLLSMTFVLCLDHPTIANAGTHSSVKKGIEAFNQGKYEDARKKFIDAQLQNPDMPELYYNIGSAAYKAEDYDAALTNFARAMDTQDPVLKDKSRFNLGNTKYRKGDLEGAVKDFEQIAEESPLHKKAMENMAFVKTKIEEQKQQQQNQNGDDGEKNTDQDQKSNENKDQKSDKNQDRQSGENKDQKDADQKNSDQKDGQNKENRGQGQNKDNQENNSGAGEDNQQKQPQEDEKNQKQPAKSDQDKQDGKESEAQKNDSEDNTQTGDEQNMAEKGARPGVSDNNGSADSRNMGNQRLLNRLEDKPGSAMMPVYSGGQPVEKDW